MRTFLRSSLVVADILGVSGIIIVQSSGLGLWEIVKGREE